MRKNLIPASISVFIAPIAIILVIVVLSITTFNVALSQISKQTKALSEAKNNEKVLTQKQAILADISDRVVPQADASVLALPEENPALIILSQLKNLSLAKTVVLKNLKVGTGSEADNLSKVSISFDADGNLINVLDFLESLKSFAPIVTIDKVKMSQVAGALSAETTLKGYWSAFPQKLPALTESTSDLNQNEKDLISKIEDLTPPAFSQVTAQEATLRDNPF